MAATPAGWLESPPTPFMDDGVALVVSLFFVITNLLEIARISFLSEPPLNDSCGIVVDSCKSFSAGF